MDKLIAACGLVCSECPALVATRAADGAAIARIAEEWSAAFHAEVKPEHVWCDGCMTASPRKCHHAGECEIRACVVGRDLAHCAECAEYPCPTIAAFTAQVEPARLSLEALRAGRS